MVTIMQENKQVATVRMLYTVAFILGKKCTLSKMTSVVPMCVDFYPYWWGLISSMFLRSCFTKSLFTRGGNWDYTLYFYFLFRQTYSLNLCQSTQQGAYNCNIRCDVLALQHSLWVIKVLLLICYLKIQMRCISFPFAIQSLSNRWAFVSDRCSFALKSFLMALYRAAV